MAATAALILRDIDHGSQEWGELTEVPLMSAMFLAMMWHATRRQQALAITEELAEERARLLDRQESFLRDVSHELRTPVTIARGHLELLERCRLLARGRGRAGRAGPGREDRRAAAAARPQRAAGLPRRAEPIDVERFLEDVFLRWSETVPRVWRLGDVPAGSIVADVDAIRIALDALIENAVQQTQEGDPVSLSPRAAGSMLVVEVADGGPGVPHELLAHIFDRFARADAARNRSRGGVGLGLSIVAAIAARHGGTCAVQNLDPGACFTLRLPGFEAAPQRFPAGPYAARA